MTGTVMIRHIRDRSVEPLQRQWLNALFLSCKHGIQAGVASEFDCFQRATVELRFIDLRRSVCDILLVSAFCSRETRESIARERCGQANFLT